MGIQCKGLDIPAFGLGDMIIVLVLLLAVPDEQL